MTVEEIRVFINAIANRDQTGNSVSPDEYNSYLARANEDLFRKEVGLRELANGTIFFDNSQVSTDALLPFLVPSQLVGTNGVFTLPADYRHAVSATNVANNKIITFLTKREYDETIIDPINFPTDLYPSATFLSGKLNVAPKTVSPIEFNYLRKPAVPFWNYNIINDEAVYDPSGSTQLEWKDIMHITFSRLILGYVGINFRDEELLQYAELIKVKGV